MSALLVLVPGLVAGAAALLFFIGTRTLRADVTDVLDVEDLALLRPVQRREATSGPLMKLADRFVPLVRRLLGERGIARLQRQVELAGRPQGMGVDSLLRQFAFWALLAVPTALLLVAQGQLWVVPLCVVIVVVMPLARLSRIRRMRKERIDRDLPDFLDILAVTVTAGVAFRPALQRCSERFEGPLGDEVQLVLGQIANGASVRASFVSMRQRNESEPLSDFVTAFLQATELGSPLSDTLRSIASDVRRQAAQNLRRQAAQTAPRVTLVTTVFMVPGALMLIFTGLLLGTGVDFGSILQ